MLRLAAIIAIAASPAAATTCDEYIALMHAEGVRTVVALGCGEEAAIPADWNEALDTPAGACLISRAIGGEPTALAFVAYMEMMNEQRLGSGCPRVTQPEPQP